MNQIITLYLKQHSVTKLRYFGFTRRDPYKYLGSGKYWKNHLRIHGKEHVITVWTKKFNSRDDAYEFATFFSEVEDIVNSVDKYSKKRYANEKPETLEGGSPKGINLGNKYGSANKGKTIPIEKRCIGERNHRYGKPAANRGKVMPFKGKTWKIINGIRVWSERNNDDLSS